MKRTGAASVAVLVAGSGKHLLADEPPVYGTSSEVEVEEETQTYNCAITDLEHTAVWTWDPANADLLDSPAHAVPQILTGFDFNISGAMAHAVPSSNPSQVACPGNFMLRQPVMGSCISVATLEVSPSPSLYSLSSFFGHVTIPPVTEGLSAEAVEDLKKFLVDFTPDPPNYTPAGIATIVKVPANIVIDEVVGKSDYYENRWARPGVCLEKISKLTLRVDKGPPITVEVAIGAKLRFKRTTGNGPPYVNCVASEVYNFTVSIDRQERDYANKAAALLNRPFLAPETLPLPPGQAGQYAFDGAEFIISVGPRYGEVMVTSSSFAPKEIDPNETLWYGETTNQMTFNLAKDSLIEQATNNLTSLAMQKAASLHSVLQSSGYSPLPFSQSRSQIQSSFAVAFKTVVEQKLSALFTNQWPILINAKGYERAGTLDLEFMLVLNEEMSISAVSEFNVGDGTSSSASFTVNCEPQMFGCSVGGASFGAELGSQDYIEIIVSKGSSFKMNCSTVNPTFKNPGESKDDAVKRVPKTTQVVSGSVEAKACCGVQVVFELEMKLAEPQDDEPDTDNPTVNPTNTGTMTLTAAFANMPAAEVTMTSQ
jgi:hypothetical protein